MVWEAVGEQRVRAHVSGPGDAGRNSHGLLPDRSGVGHFENSRSRVKKLSQIREINMRSHVVSAEIVHGIKRSEINLSRDSLAGFDFQRRLGAFGAQRRDRLALASRDLESQP